MASTGMRVGTPPDLKIKHLKKWDIQSSSYHPYQITVYANSPEYGYITFCTPETAQAIDKYLNLRVWYGDNIQDPNTFLFIKNFNKIYSSTYASRTFMIDKRPITSSTLHAYIVDKLLESGLRTTHNVSDYSNKDNNSNRYSLYAIHKNESHPCHSLRIFAVTNMQRSKVDKTMRC